MGRNTDNLINASIQSLECRFTSACVRLRLITFAFFTIVTLSGLSCSSDDSAKRSQPGTAQNSFDQAKGYSTFDRWSGEEGIFSKALTLPAVAMHDPAEVKEWLWALAHCDCQPHTKAQFLQNFATSLGALPQILVPDVRMEVLSDDKVTMLLNMPGLIKDFLSGIFVSDEKIATSVREGLTGKLAKSLPSGSQLGTQIPFNFDAFLPLTQTQGQVRVDRFTIEEQAARWSFVLSIPNLWENKQPAALYDHSLQALETMRTFVEWKYLFGLEKKPNGQPFGGLTFDTAQPAGPLLIAGPFDPRTQSNVSRFIAGTYIPQYPRNSKTLDLALNAQETWAPATQSISLGEQAMLWSAAAKAFKRVRPENRGSSSFLFGDDKIFPNDVHQLPLVFLPGLEALLDGPFVNKPTRSVSSVAVLPGSNTQPKPASLQELIRLASAVNEWRQELSNLSQAQLEPGTQARLEKAPESMLQLIQLAVQAVLKDHVRTSYQNDVGYALTDTFGNPMNNIATIAETIYVLTTLEQDLLTSPFLRGRIDGVLQWFVANHLSKGFAASSLKKTDALWSYLAIDACIKNENINRNNPWLTKARDALQRAITSSGGS